MVRGKAWAQCALLLCVTAASAAPQAPTNSRRLMAQHHPTACIACCACATFVGDDFGHAAVMKHHCRVGHCSAKMEKNNWCWDDSPDRLPLGVTEWWGESCVGQPGFPKCDLGSPCSYATADMKKDKDGKDLVDDDDDHETQDGAGFN